MAEFQENLWAPWRMAYINDLSAGPRACFLCEYREQSASDAQNHVLWRGARTLTLLNRYPYTNGHLLIAPLEHGGDLSSVPDDVMSELASRLRDMQRVLRACLNADGFNIGMNLGRCAGAGLPDHVHFHVVPRWNGDTNFMSVLGNSRIIPQSLDATYAAIRDAMAQSGVGPT